MKKIICVIPSRYESTRFPGKPLALIANKPMIQWVYERCTQAGSISDVIVATDDTRIKDTVDRFGGQAVMTGECKCGSDRVYEACRDMDFDIVINVQGDEPLIDPAVIDELCHVFEDDTVVAATVKTEISELEEIEDPNVVKVITDACDNAIYFSRYPIPYNRDGRDDVMYYKHMGIYGYTKAFLEQYVSMDYGQLERVENLEQLRILENGHKIKVVETDYISRGVDVPEQISEIERLIDSGVV